MGPLQAVGQVPVGLPVKGDTQFPNQQLLHQSGPLLRQDADGGGETQAGPGGQHILGQQVGAVVLPQGDEAPLRVAGVALFGVGRAGDDGDLPLAVARQEKRGRRPGNATTDNQDVSLYLFVNHSISTTASTFRNSGSPVTSVALNFWASAAAKASA